MTDVALGPVGLLLGAVLGLALLLAVILVPILMLRKRGSRAVLIGMALALVVGLACLAAVFTFTERSSRSAAYQQRQADEGLQIAEKKQRAAMDRLRSVSKNMFAVTVDPAPNPDLVEMHTDQDRAEVRVQAAPPRVEIEAKGEEGSASVSVGTSGIAITAERPELPACELGDHGPAISRLIPWTVAGGAEVLLIVLAYLFVDARSRGRYTWIRRGVWAAAFAGVCLLWWQAGILLR